MPEAMASKSSLERSANCLDWCSCCTKLAFRSGTTLFNSIPNTLAWVGFHSAAPITTLWASCICTSINPAIWALIFALSAGVSFSFLASDVISSVLLRSGDNFLHSIEQNCRLSECDALVSNDFLQVLQLRVTTPRLTVSFSSPSSDVFNFCSDC